jgi:hypothetical protein
MTMHDYALFAFNGDIMCFAHVLLNALDLNERGHRVRIVIEGAATQLIPALSKDDNPFFDLFGRARALGLVDGVCRACSNKMGTLEAAKALGLKLLDEMNGHPAMGHYLGQGFQITTF